MYHYAANNPVKYVDPTGMSPISLLIPDPEELSKNEARKWIRDKVCNNTFDLYICKDMYNKSMNGDSSDYIKGPYTYIARLMTNDSDAYVNKTIQKNLIAGKTFGGYTERGPGRTGWTNNDLKLSIGTCNFTWELRYYDKESKTAIVYVHITDRFDFNEGNGKRSSDAEKLTALGRKAGLTPYNVYVTYILKFNIEIPELQR